MQEAAPAASTEEPAPSPEPVTAWAADVSEIEGGHSALTPLCAVEGGFYCSSYEKTGENIPAAVVQEAKLRNREVFNDGRYDVYATLLFFLKDDGTAEPLEAFAELAPEENTENWKEYSCLPFLKRLAPDKNGNLITLECNVISGNSAPPRRADMVIGKNYLEYHMLWYVRTLAPDGSEQKTESFGEKGDKASVRFRALTLNGNPQALVDAEKAPFSWEEAGVSPGTVLSAIKLQKDGSYCFVTGNTQGAKAVASVSLHEREQEKPHLVLAVWAETPALQDAVDAFRASQQDISVTVVPLTENEALPEADLYYLPPEQFRAMAGAGLLEDLYPFLDAEKSFGREDFFPSVLSAVEKNGALLSTCAGMSFETVIGASSLVGEEAAWTYDEFLSAWSALGLGTDAFETYTTCEDVLASCLTLDWDSFIDYDAQTCRFDTEAFTKLLYFTGNFRRDFDFDRHVFSDADNSDLRIRRGKQMLMKTTLTSMRDVVLCGYEFPEEITFIGYPTLGTAGSRMIVSTLDTGCNFSMSASSAQKEAAWSFLRTFFTEAYQERYWYFPSCIHVFNRELSEAMETELLTDQWGNPVINRQTGQQAIRSVTTVYLSNYVEINIYPLTETKAERFVTMVTKGAKSSVPDEEILRLVLENVSGFYAGTQSLEEAAAQVQHAVSSYLAE